MKRKLTLALTGAALTLGTLNIAAPAMAGYKSHEHVFYGNERIQNMNQTEGNGFCRLKFERLKSTGDLSGFDPNRVNHVWAHIKNGHCIANT